MNFSNVALRYPQVCPQRPLIVFREHLWRKNDARQPWSRNLSLIQSRVILLELSFVKYNPLLMPSRALSAQKPKKAVRALARLAGEGARLQHLHRRRPMTLLNSMSGPGASNPVSCGEGWCSKKSSPRITRGTSGTLLLRRLNRGSHVFGAQLDCVEEPGSLIDHDGIAVRPLLEDQLEAARIAFHDGDDLVVAGDDSADDDVHLLLGLKLWFLASTDHRQPFARRDRVRAADNARQEAFQMGKAACSLVVRW